MTITLQPLPTPPDSTAPDYVPPDNLADAIAENALGPKKVSSDAGSAEQHSLTDQIALDKYTNAKAAGKKDGIAGLKILKISPPGSTS